MKKFQLKKFHCLIALLFAGVQLSFAQDFDLGTDAQREAGRALYMDKCSQCHGDAGAGDGVAGQYFRPQPRDFTAAMYKFRSTANGEVPSDNDIIRSIREGMPYSGMPAWPNLANEEVRNLMYHLKTYSDFFTGTFAEVEEIAVPRAPSITEEQLAEGRELFELNQCIDCHGEYGLGDGKSGPTLADKWDIHIKPADLTKRWTFRNGGTQEDIWRTVTTGLDGSPMPAYEFDTPEDKWALVNYVYSLSEDAPNYATAIFAKGVPGGDLDVSQGQDLFADASRSYFPIVGQVIEPGRSFYPGINGLEVASVYNEEEIAFLLVWHDMDAQTDGSNSPSMDPGTFDVAAELDSTVMYSDAAALIFPSEMPAGTAKPYFMFGDSKNSVDIWFQDLAKSNAELFEGKGSNNIQAASEAIASYANYDNGEWTLVFKRSRVNEEGLSFNEEQFIPVAFSVWDGFYKERGNKRGVSSWYHVYLEAMVRESPVGPMLTYGFLTLLLSLGLVGFMRWKFSGYGEE